ncbi:unnamed protein product [Absidia cylindrospora]
MTDYSWYSRANMTFPSSELMTEGTPHNEVINHQLQLFYRQLPPIPTTSMDSNSSSASPKTPTTTMGTGLGSTSATWNEPIEEFVHHGHPTPTPSNEKKRSRQMSTIGQDVRVEKNTQGKPPYSYATLIRYAIENSADQKLTLNDIYSWVLEHYSYYKTAGSGWKNSIRHNLSLNKSFVRVPRPINEPGKGSYWMIDYHAAEDEQRAKQTYRGRAGRSASDATPSTLPYRANSGSSVRRHSDTRYFANHGMNNNNTMIHPTPTATTTTTPTPTTSTMTTPSDYYYYYQPYNGYRSQQPNIMMRDYANVQHHSSCHYYNGGNVHQQQQQQQQHYPTTIAAPHYHHHHHHDQPSYSTTSSTSSTSDRPLSPTPSNVFPPELSVTLSSVTSPHSSLSEDNLGSPLPQHFAMDDQDKPRKRSKCQQQKSDMESDPSLQWPVVI